jgi:hypothetical protein
MYGVMIWVQNGLIAILTTLIIRSHNVGFANLERHTYERRRLSHPKNLECEINKIGTMLACLDLKIHKELKLFV